MRARSASTCATRRGEPARTVTANQAGPCVQLFAGTGAVPTLQDLASVDKERTIDLTSALLARGVATCRVA